MCWRRLLRVPWTARRTNQSILKKISPGCSLEGLMLKLKFQYFGTSCEELTHWKRPWCWEGLGAGGQGADRRWDGWMASPTWWVRVWVNSGVYYNPYSPWGCKESDMTEQMNWTERNTSRSTLLRLLSAKVMVNSELKTTVCGYVQMCIHKTNQPTKKPK